MKTYENFISDLFKTKYKDFDYVFTNFGDIIQITTTFNSITKKQGDKTIKLYGGITSDNEKVSLFEDEFKRKATTKEIEDYEFKKQATTYNL